MLLGVILLGALSLAGCSLAQTTPDEVSIRYSGSDITAEAEVFKKCYNPSESEHGDPGDKVYTYPAGQRTWKFSTVIGSDGRPVVEPGADAPSIQVTAAGSIPLTVSGVITFTPNFTLPAAPGEALQVDCPRLRDFHEKIGRKYGAYLRGEDDTTTTVVEGAEGWTTMLRTYVAAPMEKAIDNTSLGYDAFKLSTDPTTKQQWEDAALKAIPELMSRQAGSDFFRIDSVLLQAPQLPQQMIDGQVAKQTAQQQADAAAIAASAAQACNADCQSYQQNQALNSAINAGKVGITIVQGGSGINVQAPAPR